MDHCKEILLDSIARTGIFWFVRCVDIWTFACSHESVFVYNLS